MHELIARWVATPYVSTGRIDQLKVTRIMREVQASEAKTHLPQLLDDVERGETIVITRHGRAVARLVPPDAPVTLLDLTGNGFALLIVDYDLSLSAPAQTRPPRPVTKVYAINGITPADAAKLDLSHAAYVWLAEGTAQAAAQFGTTLGSDCSYLLQHDTGGYTVVARWPIGRYRWMTFPSGWTPAQDPACR